MSDGVLSVGALIEHAHALGVQPSVADHISRDVANAVKSVDAVRDYLDTLEQYNVRRGGEFCWHDSLWQELPLELVRRFTHRIGSLHAISLHDGTLIHAFSRRFPADLETSAYMKAFVENLEQLAREMPVDILAHPTLVAMGLRSRPAEELWTEEHETRAVDALYNAGICFEFSSRYPPHERLAQRAVSRGVRISLGSDGHTAAQVADIARPLALARKLGVPDEALYDPSRHGSKTQAAEHQRT
jgi:histidinol phosphatase-like PHP family hydrolase